MTLTSLPIALTISCKTAKRPISKGCSISTTNCSTMPASLPPGSAALPRLYTPARYAFHTVQMASHYLVQIVPSSTIRNCATYQAADALRCVSHLAYRTAELKQTYPDSGFGTAERAAWENAAAWQGFRELMEKVLVAYDWGESFVALNLVAKPAIDEVLLRQLAATGRRQGDSLLGLIADSEYRDVQRSRIWSTALVRFSGERSRKPDE